MSFWVSGLGFRISIFGRRVHESDNRNSGLWFQVSGFGFRVSGPGIRVEVPGCAEEEGNASPPCAGFVCWHFVSGFGVSGFGFRISGFRFQISGFGCRV